MKINIIFAFITLVLALRTEAAIKDQDWQSYLSKSCSTTITGGVQKMLGELSFWSHTNVSMSSWAQSMRIEKPEDYCYIDYRDASQRTKLMQCLAGYKELWDWYARCKPIVVNACRTSGGFCN